MTRRAVWAIGLGQCVSWGVLYYAFSVLVVPVERELGAARWAVVGAFSLALLVSALMSPVVGRLVDRGHGPSVVQAGGLTAAGLLASWALLSNLYLSYAIWAALGLCISAILYEPIFAIVGKAVDRSGDRLRAIATITVFGGLASTVFLPLTGALVDGFGWRPAVGILAALLAIATVGVHRSVFVGKAISRPTSAPRATVGKQELPSRPTFALRATVGKQAALVAIFTVSSFAGAALATNLVPALMERGLAPTTAAALGGLFGVMQLPGRFVVANHTIAMTPMVLLGTSVGPQAAGLLTLAATHAPLGIGAGVALFACGSGLATVARPYLVLVLYGQDRAGEMNGVFARPQHLARAAGPVAAAALAGVSGYGVVFGILAALMLAVLAGVWDRK
ncbi:MAG: MFS transporter [Acidobacteriota bacterium]|nr:MFS transporter [Acidobacteriota bacterium]MDP2320658.1 MFS transporter [Acidobacteriota bacterium]